MSGDKAILTVIGSVVAVILALLLVILLPLGVLFVPLATQGDLSFFQREIESFQQGKEVTIPWHEVVAVFAIANDQDYELATRQVIHGLASHWLEYHEREVPIYDKECKPMRTEIESWYTVKSRGTVLERMSFSQQDKERVFLHLEQLRPN